MTSGDEWGFGGAESEVALGAATLYSGAPAGSAHGPGPRPRTTGPGPGPVVSGAAWKSSDSDPGHTYM